MLSTWKISQLTTSPAPSALAATPDMKIPDVVVGSRRRFSVLVHSAVIGLGLSAALISLVFSGTNSHAAEALAPKDLGLQSWPVNPRDSGPSGFTLLSPPSIGVSFTNILRGDAFLTNAVAHNGSGVAIADVDGDGWPDLYFCRLQGPNRLYRNLGDFHFKEIDAGESACADQLSTGASFADIDGDGDSDLIVNGIAAGTRLFLNNGRGNWTEVKDSGLSRTATATSLALADIDGDGDLDLYCTHYLDVLHLADPSTQLTLGQIGDQWVVAKVNGQPGTLPRWKDRFEVLPTGEVLELPEVDGLYRNEGNGRFTAIQLVPGTFLDEQSRPMPPPRDWGLGVMFRDINGDLAPDFFVGNDNASPDRFWINTGKGTFRSLPALALRHGSRSSMGLDFADLDRDGQDDLLVLDMLAREPLRRMKHPGKTSPETLVREQIEERPLYNRNSLYLGRADGTFSEAALMAGVAATDWSWCPAFIDVDLDGYEDLLITNGFDQDVLDQDSTDQIRQRKWTPEQAKRYRQIHPEWRTPNASFRNRGNGTFQSMGSDWGFDYTGVSHGMALADLDNDGDLDVVINNLNAAAGVYRNNATAPRIAIRLKGRPPNTQGIGARLRLQGGPVSQSQEVISGGRYLSSDQALRVFAATTTPEQPLQLEVEWRQGGRSTLTNLQPNRIYEIEEIATAAPWPRPEKLQPPPFFTDVSSLLGQVHVESAFEDWARQPLLPHRLSRFGPGLCWYDFNADGWEDLIVTAARGGRLAVFASEEGKTFNLLEGAGQSGGDQSAVVGWADGQGSHNFLVGISNYEMRPGQESQIVVYSPTAAPQTLPAGPASIGPLSVADLDGDGDLDLFVGGRMVPGRFPEPATSAIWLNEQGVLRLNRTLSEPFQSVGLVTGVTFSDLDGDGDPDLALALEWGPIKVFRNQRGHFEDVTTLWGFASHTGLWTSLTSGDFDGDGTVDLAAGNWGRNTDYELFQPGKLGLFHGDWNADGTVQMLEAWHNQGKWFPLRDRTRLALGLPELLSRFATHEAFGSSTMAEILGTRLASTQLREAVELESVVFLNRGSKFERRPLPREAQLSPVFSLNVGDFDGDGIEDLFLSQNNYGIASDLTRNDSGRGLWLKGIGTGDFVAVEAAVTGIHLEGEQRTAALADFNHDGRVDLAVSQNSSKTKLYLNQCAARGIRVRLQGTPANPTGVGAQLRLRYAEGRMGPIRTVQAGTGAGSQDAVIQILGHAQPVESLWIRWPGGKEQTVPIRNENWDLQVNQ